MRTLLGFFICLGLATLGSSIECEVCSGLGASCSGSTVPCEAGQDTCIIAASQNTLVGVPMQTIGKACGSLNRCRHGPQYMNFGQGITVRSNTICCVGETCQTRTAQVPPEITAPNGKRCLACYAISNSSCSDKIVDCRGPEDHCLDMEVRVTYGTVVVNTAQKGCASKSVCSDVKKGQTNFPGGSAAVLKAECKPADIKA